jgi:peroxiredoxin
MNNNKGMGRVCGLAMVFAVLQLAAAPAPAAMPAIGSLAPDFTLHTSTGKNLKLSEQRGQVVMINFWATWCGPCRQEMPHLNRLHEQYRKAGFTLLGVNVDDRPGAAQEMANQLGVTFPLLFDTDKQVSRRYDAGAMPCTLLIDRDGKVHSIHRGYRPGFEKRYETEIRELIKQ